MDSNISWIIKDRHGTSFWRDHWIPGWGLLEDQFRASIPSHELNFPVSFYASEDGWRWDSLCNLLPADVCAKIASIKPLSQGLGDFPSWGCSSDGFFSI